MAKGKMLALLGKQLNHSGIIFLMLFPCVLLQTKVKDKKDCMMHLMGISNIKGS